MAGIDTFPSRGLVFVLKGLICEPSSLGFLRTTVCLRASTGTVAAAISKVENTDGSNYEGAGGRTVVVVVLPLLLKAVHPPSSCGDLQAMLGTFSRGDHCRDKNGTDRPCLTTGWC